MGAIKSVVIRLVLTAFGVVATFDIASGAIIFGSERFNAVNGHTYYLLDSADWTSSEADAVAVGGHLVTINDPAEDEFVLQNYTNFFGDDAIQLWIGLTRVGTDFSWVSGDGSTYRNWAMGFPTSDPQENFVYLDLVSTQWKNTVNEPTFSVYGVVEVESTGVVPEPASLMIWSMIAIGGVTLARRRVRRHS